MTRMNRVWFKGAKYHITSRGVRKLPLFYDDQDRRKYITLIEEAMELYSFNLQAYCLMPNHVHLQAECIETPPSQIMNFIHTKYAKYFNKRYDYTGHVFENRYGSELITSINYELEASRYIHLNPVKANLVSRPEEYLWSSYRFYISKDKHPLTISTKQILSYFPGPAIEHYINYVNQKMTQANVSSLFHSSGEVF
ncbi:REP element-mobilizing transposase RayT [Bacillus benzoevorans]|uniref:REP element-mobilizing transposase RayT n=2 Tax=Bacillus benzoevorans TaxID=1456 RepID=A0A7X0HUE4_9BACI|nr:REP element-mobilizing transposase RayT [Bacillus benzoevorans]